MNWSLELLLILKNFELKFGITFNSQKLWIEVLKILKNFYFKINFIHFFEDSCLQKFSFTYPCMHYLISSQKKNYAKIMAPEHIWYSIMDFQISIQKYLFISSCQHLCFFSVFLLGYCALIFLWILLWFFLVSFAMILFLTYL